MHRATPRARASWRTHPPHHLTARQRHQLEARLGTTARESDLAAGTNVASPRAQSPRRARRGSVPPVPRPRSEDCPLAVTCAPLAAANRRRTARRRGSRATARKGSRSRSRCTAASSCRGRGRPVRPWSGRSITTAGVADRGPTIRRCTRRREQRERRARAAGSAGREAQRRERPSTTSTTIRPTSSATIERRSRCAASGR